MQWIWQSPQWPEFSWDNTTVAPALRAVQKKAGLLLGKAGETDSQLTLDTLLQNIVASSAIEGERLNIDSVRSSLARHLGISAEQNYPVSDRSEGLAEIMSDALLHSDHPLGTERLFRWHSWLFPENTALSSRPLLIGQLRGEEPMQVVSGSITRPKVHFEAPPRAELHKLLEDFIAWFNRSAQQPGFDPWLRAAITHFWFITLHPFDDGNGRLARALTDMALAQADQQSIRLYAMSVAILDNRKGYYDILESSQRLDGEAEEADKAPDITSWLLWFLETLEAAMDNTLNSIERTLAKTRFWQKFQSDGLNKEQVKVLNRLLDGGDKGFEDGISAAQYQKVAKVSKATATRHLADLVAKGCIEKMAGGGRSTRYRVAGVI
tara:strand:+ start:2017 stop:3156 length:1140 start_codon:yes stop_codon:yes gene_type:complete